jgi:hypothetical protein
VTTVRMGNGDVIYPASGGGAGTVQAWVNFNGTGTVAIRDSGNVSSVSDNGTGNYVVNFTTAMANANYSAPSSAGGNAYNQPRIALCWSFSTSSISVGTVNANGTASDADSVNVAIID